MAKNLSHQDWVKQQFGKYLKSSYRNVFVHSSIIEGILANESGMDKFDSANKFLLCSQKINSSEFVPFHSTAQKIMVLSFAQQWLSKNELVSVAIAEIQDKFPCRKIVDVCRLSKQAQSNFRNHRCILGTQPKDD